MSDLFLILGSGPFELVYFLLKLVDYTFLLSIDDRAVVAVGMPFSFNFGVSLLVEVANIFNRSESKVMLA